MKLSVVTTLYQSSPYIDEFYRRIITEAKKITEDYEIIFVDDGSPDDSLHKAIALYEQDSRVKVIELSRNFGHHKAIMTGLSHATGEFVFLIDSDLEEEPELLGRFWNELHKDKEIDVIYGVQETRKGGWLERWSGTFFYKLFNKISGVKLAKNQLTCRLTTQFYNQALIAHQEREMFLTGLWAISGFNQVAVAVSKSAHSQTTYSLRHRIGMFFYALLSFSNFPLKVIFNLGIIISCFSFLYIMFILSRKIFFNIALEGWSSLIVSVWFLGGMTLLSISVVGFYIAKIFIETKNRPYTIIRKKHEK